MRDLVFIERRKFFRPLDSHDIRDAVKVRDDFVLSG